MRGPVGNVRIQGSIRAEAEAIAYEQTHPRTSKSSARAPEPRQDELLPTQERAPVIVVGVDATDDSDTAVLWAAREAETRHAHLVLVAVDETYGALPPTMVQESELRRHLDAVTDTLRSFDLSAGDVVGEVLPGTAGPALVERARNADLLVVGSRRRGSVARALLGSVSSYCVGHAACPTTVVPTGWAPLA